MKHTYATAAAIVFLTACSGQSATSMIGGGSAANIAGEWRGEWKSTNGDHGPLRATIAQNGARADGTATFANTPCSATGKLALSLSLNHVSGALATGTGRIALEGSADAVQLSGTYANDSTDACSGDVGTFVLTRAAADTTHAASSPPVIDSLEMPERVRKGRDGYFTLEGKISFHDDDGVATLRVGYAQIDQTWDFSVGGATAAKDRPVVVKFDGSMNGYAIYRITLIDVSGQSTTAERSVNLDTD